MSLSVEGRGTALAINILFNIIMKLSIRFIFLNVKTQGSYFRQSIQIVFFTLTTRFITLPLDL